MFENEEGVQELKRSTHGGGKCVEREKLRGRGTVRKRGLQGFYGFVCDDL